MAQSSQNLRSKLVGGATFPQIELPKIGGGTLSFGGARPRWTLLIVYRGKHCGRCKNYLNKFEKSYAAWQDAGFDVAVISADTIDRVQADVQEFGWSFDVGYDLSEEDMRALGLYISTPLSDQEASRNFAEPGVFCIRPDGTAQIVAISNGPAARPDLDELLDGMIFTIDNDRPARGIV